MNQCHQEQSTLMRQRNACFIEREACINSTIINIFEHIGDAIVQDFTKRPKIILGILLFASLGAGFYVCATALVLKT